MFCPQCGKGIKGAAKFCDGCGGRLEEEEKEASEEASPLPPTTVFAGEEAVPEKPKRARKKKSAPGDEEAPLFEGGRKVTPNITLCTDGVYRWIFKVDLFREPTVFLILWKIFFWIIFAITLMLTLVDGCDGRLDGERFMWNLEFGGIFLLGMSVLTAVGYLIWAAIMKGKNVVLFEMDEKGIWYKQVAQQARKAKAIGLLAIATGGRHGIGAGMAAMQTDWYTEFAKVKKITPMPRRDLIKVRQTLKRNLIYAEPEDYDFVLAYIRARVGSQA